MRTIDDGRPSFIDKGLGLPLVLIHGFPLSRDCWRPQVESLSSSFRTIAPNLHGFGGRRGVARKVTMDQFADDVASILEDLDCGPAVLVGHSMGGYVALSFARRHPHLMQGLVLVSTRSGADSPEVAAGRRSTAESVQEKGIEGVVDTMTQKILAPENKSPRSLGAIRELMASTSRDGMVGALLGMAERPDASPGLEKISVPTLVVAGAEDKVIDPAESEALAQAIPGARLRIIPAAGHLVAWEQPEAFNRELRDWLEASGWVGSL